jgi:broad specificity phosphatase PhoE
VSRILTSDLTRARETARALAQGTGAETTESALLRERSFGDHRGTPYSELRTNIFATDYAPPGGETWLAFEQRVARAWELTLEMQAERSGNLFVVSHGLVCRSLAVRFLDTAECDVPERFGNTSLTIFSTAPPHRVRLLNCVSHLTGTDDDDESAIAGI